MVSLLKHPANNKANDRGNNNVDFDALPTVIGGLELLGDGFCLQGSYFVFGF